MNRMDENIGFDMRISREPVMSMQWIEFVKFCNRLQFGRIEKLEIQNGVPVFAETVTEKVKFS